MKQIIQQRQQWLDEYRKSNPSPYLGNIVYDHDGLLVQRVSDKHTRRILADKGHSKSYEERRLVSKISMESLLSDLFRDVIKEVTNATRPANVAETLQYLFDFGQGKSSDIYVHKPSFEQPPTFTINNRKSIKVPIDDYLKAILIHEYHHAKQSYQGIKLGRNLVVDKLNYLELGLHVRSFVEETDAYIQTFDNIPLEKYHPQFLTTLATLFAYIQNITLNNTRTNPRTWVLTSLEAELVNAQVNNLRDLIQQIKPILNDIDKLLIENIN